MNDPNDPQAGDEFKDTCGVFYGITARKGSVVEYRQTWTQAHFRITSHVVPIAAWRNLAAEYGIGALTSPQEMKGKPHG